MESVPFTVQRAPRTSRAQWLRWGVMSIIFTAGGVAGYCVGTMQLLPADTPATAVAQRPDKFTQFLLAHLKKDLSLSETQYPQVEKIIREHHEEFDKIRKQTQPLFERVMADMDREMLSVLNEKQGELWKTRMKRWSNVWRGRSGGPRSDRSKRGSDSRPGSHRSRSRDAAAGSDTAERPATGDSPTDVKNSAGTESSPEKSPSE